MEFRQIVAYHGPNRWAAVPTLEVLVDLQSRQKWRSQEDPATVTRLCSWLLGLQEARLGMSGSLGQVLEQVVCALEAAAGTPPQSSGCQEHPGETTVRLTFEFEEETLGRACLETARACVLAALTDSAFDAAVEIRKLVDLADDVRLGPSTRAILRAAAARRVPCRRLTTGSLVQLGEGARQHRIWTAETDETSSIGENIAQDKELTKLLLRNVGVPVPQGRVAQSADEACAAARAIGFPVVLKPRDANHGRGISFDLTTDEQVTEAFDLALRENKAGTDGVIVERFARGHAHRLLVVGDRLVAATKGQSDIVVGNGRDTITQLIDAANADPLRGANYTDALSPMELDDVTLLELKRQGLTPASIPSHRQKVIVRTNGDLTTDETADVHPAVAERAVLAAQTVGLNIAGLDVIAADIGRPLEEQGGVIIEVNAGPGLSMHVEPLHGQPQPVGDAIVELMFPGGTTGRIPILGIAGGAGAVEIGRLIADLLRRLGRDVGLAVGGDIQIDGQRPFTSHGTDRDRIHSLLLHPRVDAAIFEARPDEAVSSGLGCQRCDVSILTAASLASTCPHCDEPPPSVLPLVHAVSPEGTLVMPAESPHRDSLLASCRGQALLTSIAGETAVLREHQARGGRVAFLLQGHVVLGAGPSANFLPLRHEVSSSELDREYWLTAIAAVWGAGVTADELRELLTRPD
jgi:cyanophycin synthetase